MFTTGRFIFVIFFIVVFLVGMIYAYKEDLKTIKIHYSSVYLLFIALILFLLILYLIVKF
ncbi:MAG TPA: hypothetical protein PK995_00915 [Bacteroidia bacterium]|jgi:hypothetical protein|nr:hypothetical protein [Bacteroidia bacterium]